MTVVVSTRWRPAFAVDVHRTLAPLGRGRADPTHQVAVDGALWRTTRMATGGATYRLQQDGERDLTCQAWGPGAAEMVAGLPVLLGADDRPETFVAGHPLLAHVLRRYPALRIARTGQVFESLVPAVLEQKVTGRQARAAFCRLVSTLGEPAPGPAPVGMRLPLPASVWRTVPSWDWHRAGVEPQRSRTIVSAALIASRLEQACDLTASAAQRRLQAAPGIGPWTAAEIAQRALGDADALSVGDFHLAAFVGWALVGAPLDDAGMVTLLEPWRGHRYRVVRLLQLSGVAKPRFGPRMSIADHRQR